MSKKITIEVVSSQEIFQRIKIICSDFGNKKEKFRTLFGLSAENLSTALKLKTMYKKICQYKVSKRRMKKNSRVANFVMDKILKNKYQIEIDIIKLDELTDKYIILNTNQFK